MLTGTVLIRIVYFYVMATSTVIYDTDAVLRFMASLNGHMVPMSARVGVHWVPEQTSWNS